MCSSIVPLKPSLSLCLWKHRTKNFFDAQIFDWNCCKSPDEWFNATKKDLYWLAWMQFHSTTTSREVFFFTFSQKKVPFLSLYSIYYYKAILWMDKCSYFCPLMFESKRPIYFSSFNIQWGFAAFYTLSSNILGYHVTQNPSETSVCYTFCCSIFAGGRNSI